MKRRLAAGEQLALIDVREADEVASVPMLEGSENIPMGQVFVEASKGTLPKDRKIVTICSKGTRCEIVARELAEKGYDIDYLEGGLAAYGGLS